MEHGTRPQQFPAGVAVLVTIAEACSRPSVRRKQLGEVSPMHDGDTLGKPRIFWKYVVVERVGLLYKSLWAYLNSLPQRIIKGRGNPNFKGVMH